jgi:hypothetical protein
MTTEDTEAHRGKEGRSEIMIVDYRIHLIGTCRPGNGDPGIEAPL